MRAFRAPPLPGASVDKQRRVKEDCASWLLDCSNTSDGDDPFCGVAAKLTSSLRLGRYMITLTFETQRYRVQIIGKSAWVECNEGARWIFRGQHPLPIALDALQARPDSATSVLRSAVDHFERTRDGDLALREALTGVRSVPAPESSKAQPATEVRSNPAKPSINVSSKIRQGFRMPLRPPLAAS